MVLWDGVAAVLRERCDAGHCAGAIRVAAARLRPPFGLQVSEHEFARAQVSNGHALSQVYGGSTLQFVSFSVQAIDEVA